MNNDIAIARNQKVFCVEETTKGVLTAPSINDLITVAGYASINQKASYTNSEEIVASRDILDRFMDMQAPGDWSFPIYARPAITLGEKPMGALLYKALMGKETVNSGVSVVYSQQISKPSFSLWVLKDHTMFFGSGATVAKGGTGLTKNGAVKWDFSGQFMKLGWGGTSEIAANVLAGDTTVTVSDARLYTENAMINLGADDNGGAGYQVTGIDTSTNVVTFTPAAVIGCSLGDYVTPWVPSGTSTLPATEAIENCGSKAVIDTVETPVQTFNITIDDPPKYLDDEITSACAPLDYVETQRSITGSLAVYFRELDLSYFHDGKNTINKDISMVAGDTPGNQMTIAMPYCNIDVPDVQDGDNTIALNMGITALGSSGEDSCVITFS